MFVGSGRIEAVDALVRSFEGVVSGSGSRLVVLSAPTGFGKSRIVQEFYARIAASQPVPAYWPARIEGDQVLRWTDSRKCVFPSSFVVPAGAQLPWFWWGVSCGKRQDGRYAQALFDDATQLTAHGGALYDCLRGADFAGRSFDGTSALIGVLGLLGVAIVPPVAIGATIAGGVKTLWQNKDLLERLGNWRAKREMRTQGAAVDAESHGRGAQISELAANAVTVSRKVPVVVVVDDAHWADPTLVEFADEVLGNPQARVLIVATTWPILDVDEQAGPFSKWLRDALLEEPKKRQIEVKTLDMLGEQDLAALVQAEYAMVAPADAQPLSGEVIAGVLDLVGGTPMGVRALFGLDRTRRLIAEDGLTLRDIGRLPRDLEDALRLYWDDIPEAVQTVLAIAAVAGFKFLPTPIVTAAAAQGINGALERLKQGENPYSFVRNVETGLATFVDPVFHDAAKREADDRFTNPQRSSIRQAIIDYALTVSLAGQGPGVCEEAWSTHVRFASEGVADPAPAALSAANLAELSASRFDYLEAIALARRSLNWTAAPSGDSQTLTLRRDLGRWLSLAGQLPEAVQTARYVVEALLAMPASHNRDALLVNAHLELAMSLKRQQKLDAAIEECRKAEDLLIEIQISDEAGISLRRLVKRAQAGCLGERPETVGQAIQMLEALLADEARPAITYGEAMEIRQGLGSLYGDQRIPSALRLARAVEVFRELRTDRERVVGVDDPATLETTHSLAYVLAASGPQFLPESLELFTRVARDRDRVLGPENPETLRTRHSVAWVTAERGDIETALPQYESLLSDSRKFLGDDHPDSKIVDVALGQLRARTVELAATTFLLANALKPKVGETLAELQLRADAAASSVPHGAEALVVLGERDPVRAHRYRALTWRRKQLPLRDVSVWRGMGGLPDSWCEGSVVETAKRLRREGVPDSAARLRDLLPLLSSIDHGELMNWLTYLPLLVVPSALLHDQPFHPTTLWTIDDGCHRAVLLSMLDVESVAALVGEPA